MDRLPVHALVLTAALVALMPASSLGCSASTNGNGGPAGPGDDDAGGDSTPTGLAPGSPCPVDSDAGTIATACRDNPVLPTCHQCVDLTDNGTVDGVCAYTCRMGKDDCPAGQTCTRADVTHRTGFQECRNLTESFELGYCK